MNYTAKFKSDRIPLSEILKMYLFYIDKAMDKGISEDTTKLILPTTKLYDNYSSVVSNKYVTRLYHLTDVPRELRRPISFFLNTNLERGILVDVVSSYNDYVIDWNSKYMRRIKDAWSSSIKKNKPSVDKTKLNDSSEYQNARKSNSALDSWNLISRKTSLGHRTCDIEKIIMLRFPKSMTLKEQLLAEDIWMRGLSNIGFGITKINNKVKPLIYEISPFKAQGSQPIQNFSTWLDENVAYSESYIPGKLDGNELFLGRDVFTNMFVFNDLLNTKGGALNILLLTETGGGKSFYIKFLLSMLLVLKVNLVIWDKDGEYISLMSDLGYPIISLGKSNGIYFNTIPILTDDPEGFISSREDTFNTFNILCDIESGMSPHEVTLLQRAYSSLMENSGIIQNDNSTWSNSKELDYYDLYNSLCRLDSVEEDLKVSYENLKRKLYEYFGETGSCNTTFITPININDFLSTKENGQPLLVDINIKIDTKTDSKQTLALNKLKSLTMSTITEKIVAYNKRRKELTAVIIEEFNQHTTDDKFIKEVHTAITSGRKSNMIPIIITNSIASMANSDNPLLTDILHNISTMIVGAIPPDERNILAKYTDLKYCEQTLAEIFKAYETKTDATERWLNSFLVRIKSDKRTEMAVIKAYVPPDLRNTIFKTRDDRSV